MADQQRLLRRASARLLADNTLTKKASLNVLAAGVDYAARILVGLLLNPLLLSSLGDTLFGVWQVLMRLAGQSSAASGRPAEALKWVVAHRQTSDDYHDKRVQVGNAVAVWFFFLPLQLLIGAVLVIFAPTWLDVQPSLVLAIRVATIILVVNLVLQSLVDVPRGVLQGENLGYRRLGLSTSLVLLGGALTAFAVALGAGLVGIATASLVVTLISGVVYWHITSSQVPWFGIARPQRSTVRRFAGLSWWFLVWNLVMRAMRAGDVIVLGIAGSAALVTSYSLTRFLPEAVTSGIAIGISGVMPGLGGLVGSDELAKAKSVRMEMMSATWLVTTVAGSLLLVWERSFLGLWVGEQYYPGTAAMVLIVVMVFQFAIIRNDSNIIDLTLNVRRKVLLGLGSAVLCVGLSWFLVAEGWGIVGLVLAFIVGRAILTVAYPSIVGRLIGMSPLNQLRGAIRPVLVTALLFSATAYAGTQVLASSWVGLIVGGAVVAVIVAPIATFGGLTARVRGRLWARTLRLVRLV